uniref:Uncharacterized protein n=1 Tax=Arundo donax TaxID=35708 RepID=A0A0A9AYB9_ARUDO
MAEHLCTTPLHPARCCCRHR